MHRLHITKRGNSRGDRHHTQSFASQPPIVHDRRVAFRRIASDTATADVLTPPLLPAFARRAESTTCSSQERLLATSQYCLHEPNRDHIVPPTNSSTDDRERATCLIRLAVARRLPSRERFLCVPPQSLLQLGVRADRLVHLFFSKTPSGPTRHIAKGRAVSFMTASKQSRSSSASSIEERLFRPSVQPSHLLFTRQSTPGGFRPQC